LLILQQRQVNVNQTVLCQGLVNFVVAGGNKLIADAAIAFKLVNVELENDVRWLLKRPESK